MIEFGYILIIVFELFIAACIIFWLIILEKRVKNYLNAINTQAQETLCAIRDVKSKLKNFNKYFNDIKKLDFQKLKQTVLLILDIVNFILLLRSMDFKNIRKMKNLRKLIPFSLIKKLIFNFKSAKKQ